MLMTRKTAEGTISQKVDVTTQMYPGDIIYDGSGLTLLLAY